MTKDEANKIAEMFRTIGGFTKVTVEEFGFSSGNYRVHLWSINAKAGNRNLTVVRDVSEVATEADAKRIARTAKGKATARDIAATNRMRVESQAN